MTLLQFHEIQPHEVEKQTLLVNLFREIFPRDQHKAGMILQNLKSEAGRPAQPGCHHWLVFQDGEAIGFVLFKYLLQLHFGFGRYVGVRAGYRNAGLGHQIHQAAVAQIAADAQKYHHRAPLGFCVEVEDPQYAPDPATNFSQRRFDVYVNRWGGQLLPVRYFEPVFLPAENRYSLNRADHPKPMCLMLFPVAESPKLDRTLVETLVRGVLCTHYGLAPDDQNVLAMIHSIQPEER